MTTLGEKNPDESGIKVPVDLDKLVIEYQMKLWKTPLYDIEGQRKVLRQMLEEAREH